MVIDISKETIIDLLKSVKPNYNVADEIPNELGYLSDGGLVNCWCWRDFDESTPYSAGELYGFYLRCKESWNPNDHRFCSNCCLQYRTIIMALETYLFLSG